MEWLYRSSYDAGSGSVIGSVDHFSVYGVGYKPAPIFTDTAAHWAKSDIDFVASRGLLTGTSDTTFSPNSTITRGALVTGFRTVGRYRPGRYASSSRFSDVPAMAYYAPFVEWAASKEIVNGTGAASFEPDRPVTREEMAVIMQRYAGKLGYTLPKEREAEIFADNATITSDMKDAVQAMQQAGVMNGQRRQVVRPEGHCHPAPRPPPSCGALWRSLLTAIPPVAGRKTTQGAGCTTRTTSPLRLEAG